MADNKGNCTLYFCHAIVLRSWVCWGWGGVGRESLFFVRSLANHISLSLSSNPVIVNFVFYFFSILLCSYASVILSLCSVLLEDELSSIRLATALSCLFFGPCHLFLQYGQQWIFTFGSTPCYLFYMPDIICLLTTVLTHHTTAYCFICLFSIVVLAIVYLSESFYWIIKNTLFWWLFLLQIGGF